jgi:cell division protein ZapE
MITPIQLYEKDLQRPDFAADVAQKDAVQRTQKLYEALLESVKKHHGRLFNLTFVKKPSVRGLYMWGGIGRGKTYLVDNFYVSLPLERKMRLHFHRFMWQIHHELRNLRNQTNPLGLVADRFAKRAQVLCLDEFQVFDITDAMLLSGLLKALFERAVTLVATSNVPPDDLYKNGLQRERFLPAIELLKQHTEVINVDSGIDYRFRTLQQAETYHSPLTEQTQTHLWESFKRLAPEEGQMGATLEVNGRYLQTVCLADGIVWFDFQVLCNIPRAVADYIQIAQCFNTVIVSNVPSMGEVDNDNVLRLINLVDEFYDRNVKLIISAQTPPEQLYTGQRQALQFQRTLSRLHEMHSHAYLQRPHLP